MRQRATCCCRRPGVQRKPVGADENFKTAERATAYGELNVTPQVAQNTSEYDTKTRERAERKRFIDGRTARGARGAPSAR
jgi:hypothetical protein